jgi:hypothetical protein
MKALDRLSCRAPLRGQLLHGRTHENPDALIWRLDHHLLRVLAAAGLKQEGRFAAQPLKGPALPAYEGVVSQHKREDGPPPIPPEQKTV